MVNVKMMFLIGVRAPTVHPRFRCFARVFPAKRLDLKSLKGWSKAEELGAPAMLYISYNQFDHLRRPWILPRLLSTPKWRAVCKLERQWTFVRPFLSRFYFSSDFKRLATFLVISPSRFWSVKISPYHSDGRKRRGWRMATCTICA